MLPQRFGGRAVTAARFVWSGHMPRQRSKIVGGQRRDRSAAGELSLDPRDDGVSVTFTHDRRIQAKQRRETWSCREDDGRQAIGDDPTVDDNGEASRARVLFDPSTSRGPHTSTERSDAGLAVAANQISLDRRRAGQKGADGWKLTVGCHGSLTAAH